MIRAKKVIRSTSLLWLVILVAIPEIGCNQTDYRMLNVKNNLVNYTFEYSTYYRRDGPRVDIEHVTPAVYLDLNAPRKPFNMVVPNSSGHGLKTVTSSYVPAAIEISVYLASNMSALSAHEALDGWVLDILESEYADSLTQSTISISGIEAEYITFTYDWFMPFAMGDETMLKHYRVAAFDYGGYIWEFTAWSEEEIIDQVKNDFEHILETFKIDE